MFAVVFRVHPGDSQKKEEYLGFAKHLKPLLEAIDGFIDNERFESSATRAGCCHCPLGVTRRRS